MVWEEAHPNTLLSPLSCDPKATFGTDSTGTPDSQVGADYLKSLNFNKKWESLDVRIQASVDFMEMAHTMFLLYWLGSCLKSGCFNT